MIDGAEMMMLPEAYWFQEGPGVRNTQFRELGIKLLNVANITKEGQIDLSKTDRHLDESEARGKYGHFLVDEGDLVIASSGISIDSDGLLRTRGAFVEKEDLPLCMNTSTIRFKEIDGKSCLSYLRHWLQSLEFRVQITRLVTGSAQKNFGPTHLKALSIYLPPLEEQKRIAAILDQADELRRKRQRAVDRLNQLSQAIFVDMFGEWDHPSANSETLQLGDHIDFLTSGSRGWAPYYSDTGALFLRIQNVKRDELDLSDVAYVQAPATAEANRTRVQPGDVLLSITADLGRTAMIPEGIGEAYINQHLAIIRAKKFDPRFLSAALSSPSGQRSILKRNREGVKAGLNFDDVRSVFIPNVRDERQREYSARAKAVDDIKISNIAALKEAEKLFTSLQHSAFRGELTKSRVKEAAA